MKFWLVFLTLTVVVFSKEVGFTQEDRERLIRLETKLEVFMEQTNRRFLELREDMNKRFELMDKRLEEFKESVNKRFEQIENELNRLVQIMIGIFAGQFGFVAAVIAFAWWDRKTIIRFALI